MREPQGGGHSAVLKRFSGARLVQGSAVEISSVDAVGSGGVAWLLFIAKDNSYASSMRKEFIAAMQAKGDTIATVIIGASKKQLSAALSTHFRKHSLCGFFSMSHGLEYNGMPKGWICLEDQERSHFQWQDFVDAGVYEHKVEQLMMVIDCCYSAFLGREIYMSVRQRHAESAGRAHCPALAILTAADIVERNFLCDFGLEVTAFHRKLDKASCERAVAFARKGAAGALETVEKIAKDQTDGSYAPWYFFFCPVQSKLLRATVFTL